jgi:DNA repair exonuclease SbcCD ATPase subunit
MKQTVFNGLIFLMLVGTFSLGANAVGLQEFLQEEGSAKAVEKVSQTANTLAVTAADTSPASSVTTHIIELVVAGIVASALIISVLVLFLGRWAGRREKKILKTMRIEAEQDQEHIISAATTIREQEKETTKIVHKIRDNAKEYTKEKEVIKNFDQEINDITQHAKDKKQEIDEISDTVNSNVDQIKSYWDEQLQGTLSSIQKVQDGLDQGLDKVGYNLDVIQEQKNQSQELLSDHLEQHDEQINLIKKNSEHSERISQSLEETLKESTQLVKLLKKYQKSAEKSLKGFTNELSAYEEQAYEQFDTSFQVADLARQELSANIDESRTHVETMRRHEEQSHTINSQTQKNLETLDFGKIAKLSNTLDSTYDMFTEMNDRVDETRIMLDDLKELETNIIKHKDQDAINNSNDKKNNKTKETSKSIIKDASDDLIEVEILEGTMPLSRTDYKIASGDNTPLSFFTNIQKK